MSLLAAGVDIRLLWVGSLLPDIIDKPLGMLILRQLNNGRIFSHALLFLVLLTAVGALVNRLTGRSWCLVLAFGTFTHLVFDSMWRAPGTLLWPLLGGSFPQGTGGNWLAQLLHALLTDPWVYLTEALGVLSVIVLFVWLAYYRRVRIFLATGRLTARGAQGR